MCRDVERPVLLPYCCNIMVLHTIIVGILLWKLNGPYISVHVDAIGSRSGPVERFERVRQQ